jgi:hypothetical protein
MKYSTIPQLGSVGFLKNHLVDLTSPRRRRRNTIILEDEAVKARCGGRCYVGATGDHAACRLPLPRRWSLSGGRGA